MGPGGSFREACILKREGVSHPVAPCLGSPRSFVSVQCGVPWSTHAARNEMSFLGMVAKLIAESSMSEEGRERWKRGWAEGPEVNV